MILRTGSAPVLALAMLIGVSITAHVPRASSPPETRHERQTAPQTRVSWQEFARDPARVHSLMRGVAKMKSRDSAPRDSPDYRTSWQYWAAMHSYYGPHSRHGGTLQAAIAQTPRPFRSLFNGLADLTPPDAPAGLGAAVWDQCQHGTAHFFPWHRLYLFYFERVLRAAANDPTLRLPYWDYTNPGHVDFPAAFGSPTENGLPNALFDARRTSQDVQLDAAGTDVDAALTLPDFTDFQSEIEGGVHGFVHCALGNGCASALMGKPAVAALDPIFWLHHANLDRLWQCWLDAGNQPPNGAWRTKTFTFVDEGGAMETIAVGRLFGTSSVIDYTYDRVTSCGRGPSSGVPALTSAAPASSTPATVASVGNVRITHAQTVVDLPVAATAGSAGAQALAAAMSPEPRGSMELVLDGISAAAPPGVLFRVYLARKDAPTRREYLGTLNFFGLTDHPTRDGGAGTRRRFAIPPRVARALSDDKPPQLADLTLVFEATLGRANAPPEVASAQFNAAAGIRIASIALRVRSTSSR